MAEGRAPDWHPSKPQLIIASDRPATHTFFEKVAEGRSTWTLRHLPISPDGFSERASELGTASAAVVDLGPEPARAIRFCYELRERHPLLAIAVLLCCPHVFMLRHLRALISDGVITSMVDLQMTEEEAQQALESIAQGGQAFHINIGRTQGPLVHDLVAGPTPERDVDVPLLELVSLGLPDHEIGKRLHLSPHTVKHHIEHLRTELGVRNRVELAAWAGRYGFYAPA